MNDVRWYGKLKYQDAKEIIREKLHNMSRDFVAIGYYLKLIRDGELYKEDGYTSLWEFAEDNYGIRRTTASRWMSMNDKFSQDGNTPILAEQYRDFGKSQLQEMLYLDDKQMEEVKPDMTVKDIRKIRTPDPEPEETEEQIPGQMKAEDFPEVLPEQDDDPKKCITGKSKSGICGTAAYCSTDYNCCAECDQSCNSRCGWLDEVCDVAQEEQPAVENANTDCPPDQSSCPRQNWGTSAEDQHEGQKECAKCWKRYKELHKDNSVSNELNKPEEDTIIDAVAEEIEEDPSDLYEEVSEKTDLDIAREENKKARMYLEMAEKEFGQNDIRIRKQKILVAALAGYICELDAILNPPEQPELPKLKNNDQREEWLSNYQDWGLWYHDDHIDVNYYKYDFDDGSRLVVAEYPQREYVWSSEKIDEYHYHLIKKDRSGYDGRSYNCKYTNYADSKTNLIEFLKNLQKR